MLLLLFILLIVVVVVVVVQGFSGSVLALRLCVHQSCLELSEAEGQKGKYCRYLGGVRYILHRKLFIYGGERFGVQDGKGKC